MIASLKHSYHLFTIKKTLALSILRSKQMYEHIKISEQTSASSEI